MQRILLAYHDPRWREEFSRESTLVAGAMSDVLIGIHHIGSTAIPSLRAKPIIDILAVVTDVALLDAKRQQMEAFGYEAMGEFGIPGRRYFRKDDRNGARTHQIHAFRIGSPQIERHLAFRDFMRAHHDCAREYDALKRRLAELHSTDISAYTHGKDAFIKAIDAKAAAWRVNWIETKRTMLRPFEESDAEQAFAWFSDAEVMRFIPRGADRTIEDTRRRIGRYREHEARFGFSKRLIIHRETGEAIGDAGLFHLPDGKRIELGYRLAKPYWGVGLAVEIGRAWLSWFDAHLAGTPLFADVHAGNTRSQRVLSKLGFQPSHSEDVLGMEMMLYLRQQ
jgi:GrpB-like predicted nucleotidyltransferase (UPF0157 family)/RimJ/RimL family protein N-acetyltransferase